MFECMVLSWWPCLGEIYDMGPWVLGMCQSGKCLLGKQEVKGQVWMPCACDPSTLEVDRQLQELTGQSP